MALVYRVDKLSVRRLPVSPKRWLVVATGVTRTSGWSGARLAPAAQQDPPFLTLDFEADPPHGPTMEVLTPIVAVDVFQADIEHRGVEVVAETNRVVDEAPFLKSGEDGNVVADFLPHEDESPAFDVADEGDTAAPPAVELAALSDAPARKCERKTLLKIPLYPEVKFKGWKCYKRLRYSVTELEWCYPTDADDTLRRCLPASIAAGVGGFAVGGPGGAVKAFLEALAACAGRDLARSVSVKVHGGQRKGRWSRC